MKITMRIEEYDWWFWVIVLLFITIALAGWEPAFYLAMEVYFLNFLNSLINDRKPFSVSVQERLVFLIISLGGFWVAGRFYLFLLLLIGTFIVAFTDKDMFASLLKSMPWNRTHEPKINFSAANLHQQGKLKIKRCTFDQEYTPRNKYE